MATAFELRLNGSILPSLATVAKYDGIHPCLTCATSAGKVFVHNPHNRDEDSKLEMRYLNFNRKVTALVTGAYEGAGGRECLLVGSPTNLLAFDVEKNKDIYFREVADGITAGIFGTVGDMSSPLAIVGGSCSILGFDGSGAERYWTVTGDNVLAMAMSDVSEDGKQELIVGSEDFSIRIFQNEEVLEEITEVESVSQLCSVLGRRFGYALTNGSVGLYDRTTRVWRVKSKYQPSALTAFDIDGDGLNEVIAGWSSGKVEARHGRTGEVIFKTAMPSQVAAILHADYRLDSRVQLLICSVDGDVRGLLPAAVETEIEGNDEKLLEELNQRKQELLYEIQNYDDNARFFKTGAILKGEGTVVNVPPDTKISCQWDVNEPNRCVDLVISTNNDTVIKAIVVFAEQLFENESKFLHPRTPMSVIRMPICSPKDVATDLFLKVLVGARSSDVHHVFEQTYKLPKFSMYVPLSSRTGAADPRGSVSFHTSERVNRVVTWLNSSFNISYNIESIEAMKALDVAFRSVRDGKVVVLQMNIRTAGQMVIKTDDMGLAAELLQDFCNFAQIHELESVANFELEMEELRNVLVKVEEHNATRMRMTADTADVANSVKSLLIKAESARVLGDMRTMRRMYTDLFDRNRELVGEHVKRTNNHAELLASLKQLNNFFQKASRLRMGTAKSRLVQSCRQALASNNTAALFKIIESGHA